MGLRDRGLKEVPENVQNVGADAKVIPTSGSWVLVAHGSVHASVRALDHNSI